MHAHQDSNPTSTPPLSEVAHAHNRSTTAITRFKALVDSATSRELQELLARVRPEADAFLVRYRDFLKRYREAPTHDPILELDARLMNWFDSPVGVDAAQRLASDMIEAIETTAATGHPGHDRRHILLKDTLSALRHCVDDKISDYRSMYLLAALGHDIGRLPEPRVYGTPASGVQGVDHQYLGYALLKLLLDDHPEIPQEIAEGMLFAVLVHQAGSDRDSFAAQFCQRADREQIVGPEFILRTIGANVGNGRCDFGIPTNTQFSLPSPGKAEETSIVMHLEFYCRNLYPNIGSTAELYITALKGMSMQFLALAYGAENRDILFGPERFPDLAKTSSKAFSGPKPVLPQAVLEWLAGEENSNLLESANRSAAPNDALTDAVDSMSILLAAPLAADPKLHRANALDPESRTYDENLRIALLRCDEAQLSCWAAAFRYAEACRKHLDTETSKIVEDAMSLFPDPRSVGHQMAAMISRLKYQN